MTASPPKVNGRTRPPAPPVLGDWQPIEATPAQADTPTTQPATAPVEPQVDSELVAQAKAEAIRAKAWAEAEEQRLRAEAEADAIRTKAEEEARKLRVANDRAERKAREEEAASEARIAESNLKRDEANRARERANREEAEQQQAEQQQANEVAQADRRWRKYAMGFYVVCAIVALPVQVAAFYNPHAIWLMAAPLMLEGGAWVVLKGAAAAVASHRPHWHYRLIAWLLAFIAAGINLAHGLIAFDVATAVGTAFASVAGPGVWDLHEHGRIRKRDGVLTRRERKAQEKVTKAAAKQKAADEAQRAAEKKVADEAADKARQMLLEERQREFPKVWAEAVKIGAALAKAPDDPAVWPRAYRNIEGCEPGESIESITARRAAEKRVEAALSGTPVNTLSKTTNAQRVPHLPKGSGRGSKTGPKVRGVRRSGDSLSFSSVARKQASITAKNASEKKG
ncbi:hypothetical protein ACWDBD_17295 [Streptomyces sp. NPDC001118]